jgi:hypothetical protein
MEKTKVSQIVDIWESSRTDFDQDYWVSGDENARFMRAKHWSTSQEDDHTAQGRQSYSIPLLESKMAVIVSQQMQNPYDIIAIGRTEEDEVPAEIKNAIFKYLSDTNELTYVMSEAYQDALVKKYGVVKRYIDYSENVEGDIYIEKVIYKDFMWDRNCKKYNISRYASWCAEQLYMTKQDLKDTYPHLSEKIDALPDATKDNKDDNTKIWYVGKNGLNYVNVIKFYERRYKKYYSVTYLSGKIEDEEKKPDINEMTPDEMALLSATGADVPVDYIERTKEYLICYLVTKDLDEVLEEKEIDSYLMPYHVIFAENDDGDLVSLVDKLKDPQRIVDRYFSQIDASIGKLIKSSYEIGWSQLHPEDQAQWEALQKKLVSGGAILRRMGGQQLVYPIQTDTVPPQLFTTMQIIIDLLGQFAGGNNYQGLQESAGESGKAIIARQQQGFLMAYRYIYNLVRTLRNLGEGLNEDINEVYGNSVERIVEITDNELDELVKKRFEEMNIYKASSMKIGRGYLKVDKDTMLGKAKSRIIIVEGKYQPSEKERKLKEWFAINKLKIEGGERPYPITLYANELGFSPSVINKMKEFDAKQEQMQQEEMDIKRQQALFQANLMQQQETRKAGEALNKEREQINQDMGIKAEVST